MSSESFEDINTVRNLRGFGAVPGQSVLVLRAALLPEGYRRILFLAPDKCGTEQIEYITALLVCGSSI